MSDHDLFDSLDESDPVDLRAIVEATLAVFPDDSLRALRATGAELRRSIGERLPDLDLDDFDVHNMLTVFTDEILRPVIGALEVCEIDDDTSQAIVATTMGALLYLLEPGDGDDR